MGKAVEHLNPKILQWARVAAGYSEFDVAEKLKKSPDLISGWEQGVGAPTYPQLERLAYQIYKRPVAVFFFPGPPEEETPEHSFRTLPGFEIENLNPRVRYLRREALAMQDFLAELNGPSNLNWSEFKSQVGYTHDDSVQGVAVKVRSALGISFDEQIGWKSTKEAFEKWRSSFASVGLYVFKEAFDQALISGFCLHDREYPVIYINNSNSRSRQIFSLFHELGHLICETGGVTTANDSFIDLLPPDYKRIEIFCNKFASEVLVPSEAFEPFLTVVDFSDDKLNQIARSFSVSKEVILRKYLDTGLVSPEYYQSRVAVWNDAFKKAKQAKKKGGGDYYATQTTYLGKEYVKLALTTMHQGKITSDQAAEYLKVKPDNLEKLEGFYLEKVAS